MDFTIRPLDQDDLSEADRIFRLAFGTYFGLPDPMSFMGDADLVKTRWHTDPAAAFGAYVDGELVGSNFATNWGSFGTFGPLTVRPDLWDQGIARRLLMATMGLFERWGTRQVALFTDSCSPKHLALYQKFGFWPQYLTPVMAKPVKRNTTAARWSAYSDVPLHDRENYLAACRELTHGVFPGLDVQREIRAVDDQHIGDTVLIDDGEDLLAFAVCHLGTGSEAGTGAAYIKFGAVRPGPGAAQHLAHLLSASEALAREHGLEKVVGGVNTARHDTYRIMIEQGFSTLLVGVAMQRPNEPAYNRPDCFVIDDWR